VNYGEGTNVEWQVRSAIALFIRKQSSRERTPHARLEMIVLEFIVPSPQTCATSTLTTQQQMTYCTAAGIRQIPHRCQILVSSPHEA
jgi:hypothetical protein